MSKEEKKIKIEDGDKNQQVKEAKAEESTQKEEGKQENAEEKAEDKPDDKQEDKDPLKEAQEQIADQKDKYLRLAAEFDNYKKRTKKEMAEVIYNGGANVITAILPILDDMERATANFDKAEDKKTVEEGWELIFKKLQKTLSGLGVEQIKAKDADFNVDFHEAVAMVPVKEDDKKGKVIDCIQTGYTLNGKVIRHAKVAVGQ